MKSATQMPHIFIHTDQEWLGQGLAQKLRELPSTKVEVIIESTWSYELVYSANCVRTRFNEILNMMAPLTPKKRINHNLSADSFHIYLGSPRNLHEFPIQLKTDSQQRLKALSKQLSQHFKCETRLGSPTLSVLKFGGAPLFICDAIRWLCKQEGHIEIELDQIWSDEANDIHLFLQDSQMRGEKFRKNLNLIIYTDNQSSALQHLTSDLVSGGYDPSIHTLSIKEWPSELEKTPILLNQEDFILDLKEAERLVNILHDSLQHLGVDTVDYPAVLKQLPLSHPHMQPNRGETLALYLPLKQLSLGQMNPNGGSSLRRWQLEIFMQELSLGDHFTKVLEKIGFTRVSMHSMSPMLSSDLGGGVHIDWGSALEFPEVQNKLIQSFGCLGDTPVIIDEDVIESYSLVDKQTYAEDNVIMIQLFEDDFFPDKWREKIKFFCSSIELVLITENDDDVVLLTQITSLPWSNVEVISREQFASKSSIQANYEFTKLKEQWSHGWSDDQWGDDQWDEDEWDDEGEWDDEDEWDQSGLQDWLMSSLHDDVESEVVDITINYGGAPRFLIEWMKDRLMGTFDVLIGLQRTLPVDDCEVIITLNKNLSTLRTNILNTESLLEAPQTLLIPPSRMQLENFDQSVIDQILQIESSQQILRWKDLQIPINPPQSLRNQKIHLHDRIVFHPHFMRVCEFLFKSIAMGQSKLIYAPTKLGLSTVLTWLSQVTNSPLISSSTSLNLQTKNMLGRVKTLKQPMILVDGFDLLSTDLRAHVMRSLISLNSGGDHQRPVLLASLSSSYNGHSFEYSSADQRSGFQRLDSYEGLDVISIESFSLSDWYEALRGCYQKKKKQADSTHSSEEFTLDEVLNQLAKVLCKISVDLYQKKIVSESNLSKIVGYRAVKSVISNIIQTDSLQPFEYYLRALYSRENLGDRYDDVWQTLRSENS